MNRALFLLVGLMLAAGSWNCLLADPRDDHPTPADREHGFRYQLVTAESLGTEDEKTVSNINGQIGLIYKKKRAGGIDAGVYGDIWRGQPITADAPFSIRQDSGARPKERSDRPTFDGLQFAYCLDSSDRSVNLNDRNHVEIHWREVVLEDELFKKYIRPNAFPFRLQAVAGEFDGYYLDFGDAELVKVDDTAGLKDRSYVRRQAILVKKPSELSILVKLKMSSK